MVSGQSVSGTKSKAAASRTGGPQALGSLEIKTLALEDLRTALIRGFRDFDAVPSHGLFLAIIYPLIGLIIFRLFVLGLPLLPMLYPLAAGFALLGPFAAVGLYELSRRREQGLDVSPLNAFDVIRAPGAPAIGLLGLMLLAIFFLWLVAAHAIFLFAFGEAQPATFRELVWTSFTTQQGWKLVFIGNGVGFLFAALTFCVSVVSFPIVLDRNVGAGDAVWMSMRVVAANPLVMAAWGLFVASALAIASLLFFVGLIVVLPVLAHASWHLYRIAVETKKKRRTRSKA
jgi:uncharacterized membrane protein